MKVEVRVLAYAKVVLHTCKHPFKAVNGVLLGAIDQPSGKEAIIIVQDVVPLFHLALGLTPMLELALTQIEIYAKEKGMKIVGYYQANEHLKDLSPDLIAQRICDKIGDVIQLPVCLLMVDNEKLRPNSRECALKLFDRLDGKNWKEVPDVSGQRVLVGGVESLQIVNSLMATDDQRKLVDFDQHLDDTSKDWRNPSLEETIRLACRGL
eukprot:m.35636 g.35636  ORF g.35636 m.35636 type:complete len:209 (+) comp32151_c1_seq1:5149-5775(+)